MKIRYGFVANSSSSSFIVAFPKAKPSVQEIQEMLFGDRDIIVAYDESITANMAAKTIHHDILAQDKSNPKAIEDAFNCGSLGGDPNPDKYRTLDDSMDWDSYEKDRKKIRKKIMDKFLKENKSKVIYVFSYADEDGPFGSVMEHGGIFDNLTHVTISCH